MTITRIGCTYFEIFDAHFKDTLPKLPCELTEGKRVMANVSEINKNSEELHYFYANDATGREYKLNHARLHRRIIWAVRRWYERLTESS